jgi:hypothetical protein
MSGRAGEREGGSKTMIWLSLNSINAGISGSVSRSPALPLSRSPAHSSNSPVLTI